MNFFKRALASVSRRKGKSIILFAVVFILGNVIAGAISIQQATTSVEKNIKSQLGGTATVGFNQEEDDKFWKENPDSEDGPKTKQISQKQIEEIGNLSYVKYYDYSIPSGVGTSKLKNYDSSSDSENSFSFGGPGEAINNYFEYRGVNYPKLLDIEEKKIELVEGRVFEEQEIEKGKDVVIISKQLATENNLSLGDKLVVDASSENYLEQENSEESNPDSDTTKAEVFTQDQVFEIIGLFVPTKRDKEKKTGNQNDMSNQAFMDNQQFNKIYMPNATVKRIDKEFNDGMMAKFPDIKDEMEKEKEATGEDSEEEYLVPYFVLKSPEDAEAFREEASPYLPDKYSKLILSTDQYDSIAGPVKNMSKIAKYVIVVSVAATLLIISLVVLLFLRDRKHELGIYLSLGESRSKVISQIVIEVVLIAFVAISLSVFTGNILGKSVSGSLLQTQIKADQEKQEQNGGDMDDWQFQELTGNKIGSSEVADSYAVSLTPTYIIVFYVVGLATVLLSTVIPLVYILRLNPKKIMM